MTFKKKKGLGHNMDAKKLILWNEAKKDHFFIKKYEDASIHRSRDAHIQR